MKRNLVILMCAVAVVALPFILRRPAERTSWRPGDPELIIISPHNEAIRFEFAHAFSRWHEQRYGKPVRIDWRAIGGTAEISRYLTASFVSAARAWWVSTGRPWPAGAGEAIVDRRFDLAKPPIPARRPRDSDESYAHRVRLESNRWEIICNLYRAFRETDDPSQFTAKIDLFFGGGDYDHQKAFGEGLTVAPWPPDKPPRGLFTDDKGRELIPARIAGETWRTPTMYGAAISTFGICFNLDRLRELGIQKPPETWRDLTDPRYFRQIGVADPTKSGSIAKAFELIVHQQCYEAIRAAGFSDEDIDRFEAAIATAKLPHGEVPDSVPASYQRAIEHGWAEGLRLIQQIGANARYFTDSSSKVPIDVSMGAAAAGIAIDFYGRFQAQSTRAPDGRERMGFVTPPGGSGVSCDPISLLRGAPNREIAVRFIEFVLSEDGQKVWTYRPGTPGGPIKYALRRVPIRRTFFPSDDPEINASHRQHLQYSADNLADPRIDPYALARQFTYRPRWTASHFGIHRDLIRAMCLDSSSELQAAWDKILRYGGPHQQGAIIQILGQLPDIPEPVTWRSAPRIGREYSRLDYMRDWTRFYRARYREVQYMLVTSQAKR
jgi:ABC-type Fe3+ transport system substrate-binding protein